MFSLILISCFLCIPPPPTTFLENNKINNLLTFLSKFYKKIFPGGPDGKDNESTFIAGDLGSIPGSGRSPGERNGNLLQHSCLENPVDRGAWRATVHRVTKSRTRLSVHARPFYGFHHLTPTGFSPCSARNTGIQ